VFFKKKKSDKSKSTVDKLVTWIIIGWAVASMVGLSKTNKWQEITKSIQEKWSWVAKKGFSLLGKSMVWVLSIFNKKK
jgi:hypothetical protein